MSRVPGWLGKLGAGLTEMSERLDARRVEVEQEDAVPGPSSAPAPARAKQAATDVAPDAVPRARRSVPSGPVARPDPAQAVP